jgi:hypothetical protein
VEMNRYLYPWMLVQEKPREKGENAVDRLYGSYTFKI